MYMCIFKTTPLREVQNNGIRIGDDLLYNYYLLLETL